MRQKKSEKKAMADRTLLSTCLGETDSMDSLNQSPRKLFYQSPYKKVPGTASPIGLPDTHIYEQLNLFKFRHRTSTQEARKSRKTSRFLDPEIWNFQEHVADNLSESDLSASGKHPDPLKTVTPAQDFPTKGFCERNNLMLPRLPTIEQMYDNPDHADNSDNVVNANIVKLPSIFNDKVVINTTEERCSDEESEPFMQKTFGSLKQIDTIITNRKESTNELLPPVSFRPRRTSNTNSLVSFSSCDDQSSTGVEKRKKHRDTKTQGQKTKGKHRKKSVHFTKEKQKKIINTEPKLPKVIGLRLTLNDIKERELPPIITKYLLGCTHQSVYNLITNVAPRNV